MKIIKIINMSLNNLTKFTGILRIRILNPDFDSKTNNIEYIYTGGLCIQLKNNYKYVCAQFITGIIDAEFYTYKELLSIIPNELDPEKIDWTNSHKLRVELLSKQWDYVKFSFNDLDFRFNFINFPKINKINQEFSNDKNYLALGMEYTDKFEISSKRIIINSTVKINLIHNSLPKQIFYLGSQIKHYSGSVIYSINEQNSKIEIIGFTSNDYDESSRIIPIKYLEYFDVFLNTETISYNFNTKNILEYPMIKASTDYQQLIRKFSPYLKKNDVIISVNNQHINDFNKYETNLTLNEYLIYCYQTKLLCKIKLLRKNIIMDIKVDMSVFKIDLINEIYIDIHDDIFIEKDSVKFSSDICDLLLLSDDEKFNDIEIQKYLNDITYKIEKLNL
jgi:hypothetical protein